MNREGQPKVSVVFPGQGAQETGMLERFRAVDGYRERCEIAASILDCDLFSADPNRNEIGSILTILASSFAWEEFRQTHGSPDAFAGYSVGAWTALWAAGMIDFPTLIDLTVKRARLMNTAVVARPGGMLAVVGLGEREVRDVVHRSRTRASEIHIANFNAPGNVTLAGEITALKSAQELALEAGARQVKRLSVAGAWHCPLMSAAACEFEALLGDVSFSKPDAPVIDNVTGEVLPTEVHALRRQLAIHLEMPVQWEQTIRKLISMGCEEFVEVGHGSLLSQFGFFIDRGKTHRSYAAKSCAV